MYTDDIDYASTRLKNTIVRIEEEPFMVDNIIRDDDGDIAAVGTFLKDANQGVLCKVEHLNLEPVKLGYVNFDDNSFYVVRKPIRNDWRQGLRLGNAVFIGNQGFYEFPFKELRDTILNNYPSLRVAHEMCITGYYKAVAFASDFAVNKSDLFYKSRKVGSMDKIPTLLPQYQYLNEYLQEVCDANR